VAGKASLSLCDAESVRVVTTMTVGRPPCCVARRAELASTQAEGSAEVDDPWPNTGVIEGPPTAGKSTPAMMANHLWDRFIVRSTYLNDIVLVSIA
jgi:hypothetical protein